MNIHDLIRNGFTLIEVLIAITVLSIAILSFYKMHTTSYQTDALSRKINIATFLANEKIENLKTQDISTLNNGIISGHVLDESNKAYAYSININNANGSSGTISKIVTITIGWDIGISNCTINNCEHKVDISSLISENDL